jgi:hypothetical protein
MVNTQHHVVIEYTFAAPSLQPSRFLSVCCSSIKHLPPAPHSDGVLFDGSQILAGDRGVQLVLLASKPIMEFCIDEQLDLTNTPFALAGDRYLVDSGDERL